MSTENKSLFEKAPRISAALFIAVAIIGILLTVWIADGSTVKGIIGGIITLALAWLTASKGDRIFG